MKNIRSLFIAFAVMFLAMVSSSSAYAAFYVLGICYYTTNCESGSAGFSWICRWCPTGTQSYYDYYGVGNLCVDCIRNAATPAPPVARLNGARSSASCFTDSAGSTPVTSHGGSDGKATVFVSDTTTYYTSIQWSDGQTLPVATGLRAGTYTVTVTAANGCTASTSVTVTQPPSRVPALPKWGLIILTLSLLTAGMVFSRRRRALSS